MSDNLLSNEQLGNDCHPLTKTNGEGGIRTRGTSLNRYDGLANRCAKTLRIVKTKTYSKANQALTNQLTKKNPKHAKMTLPPYRKSWFRS